MVPVPDADHPWMWTRLGPGSAGAWSKQLTNCDVDGQVVLLASPLKAITTPTLGFEIVTGNGFVLLQTA